MSENFQVNSSHHPANHSMDIQVILSRSYLLFLFSFVFGFVLDLLFHIHLNIKNIDVVGFILIIVSSFLILWAQTVNKKPKYLPDGGRNFAYGPYAFSRHPTYLGIFILMIGAGFMMNSVSMTVMAFVAIIASAFTFMAKEEKRHINTHGEQYLNYTKKVRRII